MGIKQFFGKSLLSLIRDADRNEKTATDPRVASDMERMFGSATPALVAFKIDNGYVVRTIDVEQAYVGGRVGGFTFCKDHAEIAQHIVASEAKRKLGIGEEYQQEMFAAEKARAVAMQAQIVPQPKQRAVNRI